MLAKCGPLWKAHSALPLKFPLLFTQLGNVWDIFCPRQWCQMILFAMRYNSIYVTWTNYYFLGTNSYRPLRLKIYPYNKIRVITRMVLLHIYCFTRVPKITPGIDPCITSVLIWTTAVIITLCNAPSRNCISVCQMIWHILEAVPDSVTLQQA